MKFQPDKVQGPSVTAYGEGWVAVNGEPIHHSLVLPSHGTRFDWQCAGFEALDREHFDRLAALDCELVVFGSGARLRFPNPAWLQALYARRIGVETMDTPAACRTFNFLAGEGRKVVAALLV